ncbi:MAG: hypothetical protein AAF772_10390 [Acidobacteriota bacterium]
MSSMEWAALIERAAQHSRAGDPSFDSSGPRSGRRSRTGSSGTDPRAGDGFVGDATSILSFIPDVASQPSNGRPVDATQSRGAGTDVLDPHVIADDPDGSAETASITPRPFDQDGYEAHPTPEHPTTYGLPLRGDDARSAFEMRTRRLRTQALSDLLGFASAPRGDAAALHPDAAFPGVGRGEGDGDHQAAFDKLFGDDALLLAAAAPDRAVGELPDAAATPAADAARLSNDDLTSALAWLDGIAEVQGASLPDVDTALRADALGERPAFDLSDHQPRDFDPYRADHLRSYIRGAVQALGVELGHIDADLSRMSGLLEAV